MDISGQLLLSSFVIENRFSKLTYRNPAQLKGTLYLIIHSSNVLEMRCLATVRKHAPIIDQTLDAILTLLIWMLSSCCCHCRMFSMRCTQILMFPTSTDLPMSCTRLQSDTYSVCSSSLMGLTFCWSSRTKTEQEQEEFRITAVYMDVERDAGIRSRLCLGKR